MKKLSRFVFSIAGLQLLVVASLITGCVAPTSTNKTIVALQDPNNEAKAVQLAVAAGTTEFLANHQNNQYAPEVVAVADALALLAAGNPQNLTGADIAGLVSATKVNADVANQATVGITTALGIFNSAFAVNFPTLKPNYTIFLLAVSNGLHIGTGGTAVALPVIPWPPAVVVTAPAPTA